MSYSTFLSNKRVCVKVARKGNKLEVQEGIYFLAPGTAVLPIKSIDKIVDIEGNEIEATGQFYTTAETIDPYHMITDLF